MRKYKSNEKYKSKKYKKGQKWKNVNFCEGGISSQNTHICEEFTPQGMKKTM